MMQKLLVASVGLFAIAGASPVPFEDSSFLAERDILQCLPEAHKPFEVKLHPLLDFDSDGCYNTAAVDPSGSFAGGHGHDWENIIVFSTGNNVLVYNKNGRGTHCFRFANSNDIAHPDNPFGVFYRSPLVGWNNWPSVGLRNKMLNAWKCGVGPKLDDEFGDSLKAAAGMLCQASTLILTRKGLIGRMFSGT
ncbi:necrosis-inducing protein [Ilyonectria destructans]|nr:necrosis-inducing protein [Ilyonectria destructans]